MNAASGAMPPARRWLIAGALLMALATAAGALAAHALKNDLAPDRYGVLQTAVLYQFVNALGLLVIGALATRHASRALRVAGDLLLAGVLLFCGSLYLLLCRAPHWLGVLTPIGGSCLIAGWLVAAAALWRSAN
jgi:uncharacterized membrane protein YgdD (TMEM256/DUF423 family)